ncbi:MAG: DUF1592 domain-containing protein [Pirellulales bacterium]
MKRTLKPALTMMLFAFAMCGTVAAQGQQDTVDAVLLEQRYRTDAAPFLDKYCAGCHNADKPTSGVRVDQLNGLVEDRHFKLLSGLGRQVTAGKMPPEEEPQPSAEEKNRFSAWIDDAVKLARMRPTPKNGSTRRLTKAQYRHTLRDLLGIDEELTDILPPDAVSREGFTNNQETLGLSPLLIESYFEIAEKALDCVLVDPNSRPTIENFKMDLGRGINANPCPDKLILGAESLLLKNEDFIVTELTPEKSFAFDTHRMQTKFRFIEGYVGNDTIREWRDFSSIYHSVFACMRGKAGYPKGEAFSTVPGGLLLRPSVPSVEVFGVESTYGPQCNFKISLRELPDNGRFRVTVRAAKVADALLLEPAAAPIADNDARSMTLECTAQSSSTLNITDSGVYQVDLQWKAVPDKPKRVELMIGDRHFSSLTKQSPFILVRLASGEHALRIESEAGVDLTGVRLLKIDASSPLLARFETFERRVPKLGVHMGLRRDCGSTLNPVASPQVVDSDQIRPYVFEGAIRNFPSPEVEKDNVNYLAGIREIGVRSEYTDGRDMPRLLVQSVEFEGPLFESWPPASHQRIFFDRGSLGEQEYVHEVLKRFGERALRRPPTPEELASWEAIAAAGLKGGAKLESAVRDVLQVILTSPQFLFLIETSASPEPEQLGDWELASKLSYFLWNSPPDAELIEAARRGTLHAELDKQVDRLLADPRAGRFADEFVAQWLALDKFDVLEPDRTEFPELTKEMRAALRREPIEWFLGLARENATLAEFFDAQRVAANEVTAKYYGLNDQVESGFAFTSINLLDAKDASARVRVNGGGLFSQAAIMAGLSNGRESNPIKRGAWLARRIIAEPPDDPPPNVPALKETDEKLSLRERLEQHRNQPGCAQCHGKIDPWGVPFEEFDAGGRLKSIRVDARSVLPDGTEVAGTTDLKRYLTQDRIDQTAYCLLKHLTVYACGRHLSVREDEWLKREGRQLRSGGYRIADMIRFTVQSPMFLEK